MTKVMVKKSSNLIKLTETKEHGFRISSMAFVEHSGVTYKATNNLVRKHKTRLETFGSLPFEKAAKSKTGQEIHAFLNEDQAIFLLTLSKNTEQVVDFKHRLVTAFAKLRRKQAIIDENHAKVMWQQNRTLGKLERRGMTDVIQRFVDYAKAQGSRGAGHYYTNISKRVNKAVCVEERDEIGEDTLHILATAERVAEKALQHGMKQQLPYKSVYQGLSHDMQQFTDLVIDNEEK